VDFVNVNGQIVKIVTIEVSVNVSTADESLVKVIADARLKGIFVVVKIKTAFGKRSLVDIKAHIDLCVRLYGVVGFIFDEVPSDCSCQTYYSELYAYVKVNVAGLVVLNVGVNVPECFALFGDILVVFDSSYDDYLKFVPLPWYKNYPASTFWHNIHSCPKLLQRAALSLAIKLNAGFCYVTDKAYGLVPSLLDLQLQVNLLNLQLLGLKIKL